MCLQEGLVLKPGVSWKEYVGAHGLMLITVEVVFHILYIPGWLIPMSTFPVT